MGVLAQMLTKVANQFKGLVMFVTVDTGEESAGSIAEYFGLDKLSKEPQASHRAASTV